MAHKLTERERSKMWDAFSNWDIIGEGTIAVRDMCKVMELLGETPSADPRMLSNRPDAGDEHVDFEEFLIMTVGSPWEASGHDYEEELNEALAAIDDGNRYVPLRELMRVVHEHIVDSGCYYSDDEMVDIYRHALDVSLFETVGGSLAPEVMWKVFEEEFDDLRKGPRTEYDDPVGGCARVRAGGEDDSTNPTADMVNVMVVDLGGKELMFDTVPSSWPVQALQQDIEDVVGLPVHRQVLYLARDDGYKHELSSKSASLSTAGVSDGSAVVLVMKDELKLDYKGFLARLFDGELM